MTRLTAGVGAAEAGQRAAGLASELEQMFSDFRRGVIGATEEGWPGGLTPQALDAAQALWVQKAHGLTDAQIELGNVVTKNVNAVLDADDAFSKRLSMFT